MNSPIPSSVPKQAPLTETAFCAWLGAAAPGDTIIYYRGALARDTCAHLQILAPDDRARVARLAGRALKLAEAGLVHLVQRRRGVEDFEYLAIARPRPRRIARSRMPLLQRGAA